MDGSAELRALPMLTIIHHSCEYMYVAILLGYQQIVSPLGYWPAFAE